MTFSKDVFSGIFMGICIIIYICIDSDAIIIIIAITISIIIIFICVVVIIYHRCSPSYIIITRMIVGISMDITDVFVCEFI